MNEPHLLEACVLAARAAGAEILKLVAAGYEVETKSDLSPVTICDRAAEAIILGARQAAPAFRDRQRSRRGRIPVHGDTDFLVDPFDGPKSSSVSGDFTVIRLFVNACPALLVYRPLRPPLGRACGAGRFGEAQYPRTATRTRDRGPNWRRPSKSHLTQSTSLLC